VVIQIADIPAGFFVGSRGGVAIALLCVAFFRLPQSLPRYTPGEEPSGE
jgi:hypothetical protein